MLRVLPQISVWIAFGAALALLASMRQDASAEAVPLFNGVDLTGWSVVGGSGTFEVDGDQIVGRSDPASPINTFLVTDTQYSDFVLDFEFFVADPTFNSGVQFRSHSIPSHNIGRLFGHQIDIDPTSRQWTGGIYYEGGSPTRPAGWLDDLADNPVAGAAFNLGEWNTMHAEVFGRSIRTWINGVPAADYYEAGDEGDLFAGHFALQVHTNGSPTPLEVRWRNLLVEEVAFAEGDFGQDGAVGLDDYQSFVENLGKQFTSAGHAYLQGDFDGDLSIGYEDFLRFRSLYQGPPLGVAPYPTPEPASVLLMLSLTGFAMAPRGPLAITTLLRD